MPSENIYPHFPNHPKTPRAVLAFRHTASVINVGDLGFSALYVDLPFGGLLPFLKASRPHLTLGKIKLFHLLFKSFPLGF